MWASKQKLVSGHGGGLCATFKSVFALDNNYGHVCGGQYHTLHRTAPSRSGPKSEPRDGCRLWHILQRTFAISSGGTVWCSSDQVKASSTESGRKIGASQGFDNRAPTVRCFIVLVIFPVRVWRSFSEAEF